MTLMTCAEARALVNQRKKDTVDYVGIQTERAKEEFNDKIARAINDHKHSIKYCIYHRELDISEVETFNNFISELKGLNYHVEYDTVDNFKTIVYISW